MAEKSFLIAFDGEPVEEEFYEDIMSLTVDESVAAATSFRLQLAVSLQDDGDWTHLDDDRFALFRKVSIDIGWSGGGGVAGALGDAADALGGGGNDELEPVFDGYVTGVEMSLGSEPDSAILEISGLDASVLMSLEEKIATWKNMADSDIVKQIVGGIYGITIQTEATPVVHKERDTTVVQRGTDIQFVRDLARRNGAEFFFETDRASGQVMAYFRSPGLDGTPQPDLAIQFGDESNLQRFAVRLSGQRPLSARIEQLDVKSRKPRHGQAAKSSLAVLGLDDATALIGDAIAGLVRPKDAAAQTLVLGPPTSDQTELDVLAQAVRDEADWLISADGEVNGDAYEAVLRPRRPVLVKGVGIYDGAYYVSRVVHALTGDGSYTQTFEARRNAREPADDDEFGGGGLGPALAGRDAVIPAAGDDAMARLIERVDGRYYGKYRGLVTDNKDPDDLGRVKAKVPRLLGDEETGWALPAFAYGGAAEQGLFAVPDSGAGVWIEFEGGDLSYPIWSGTWFSSKAIPESARPGQKVWKTKSGHKLVLDDDAGTLVIADANGNSITMDANGIEISDANGNSITMSAAGVSVNDGALEVT